jgi:hypothetical protein
LAEDGSQIPIWGGARLSGKIGKYSLGLLDMQTKERDGIPGNNFGVFRVKRNVLANSDIGFIFATRQASEGKDYSRAVGGDVNFRFWRNLTANGYLAKTLTDGLSGNSLAKKMTVQWLDDFWKFQNSWTDLPENFNPEVGFTQRRGTRYYWNRTDFYPRPKNSRWIRQFNPHMRLSYFLDENNRLVTKDFHYALQIFFQDGGSMEVHYDPQIDRLDKPFEIRKAPLQPAVTIPTGNYHFAFWALELNSDPSKMLSGTLALEKGSYYSGHRTTVNLTGTFRPSYRFAVEPKYSINKISLEDAAVNGVPLQDASFTTHLASSRISYYFNTRMSLSALMQYNSDRKQVTSNIRFNWIHHPLSDLFLVYNEQRDVSGAGKTDRGFSIKYTHLIPF